MSRSSIYSSFLTSTPRVMEPMMLSEVTCANVDSIDNILLR